MLYKHGQLTGYRVAHQGRVWGLRARVELDEQGRGCLAELQVRRLSIFAGES